MKTIADRREGAVAPSGTGGALRLEPSTGRRARTSWIALGLLVLLGFGLLGAVTVARVADRTSVLALAQPIDRGEELTAAHLMAVEVGTDGTVLVATLADRDALLGQRATGPMEAGTLVTRAQFASGPSIPEDARVVGLALAPGEYPTRSLRPGDRVVVVRTPPVTPGGDTADTGPATLVEAAEVFAVDVLSDTAHTLMASVVVPAETVADITAAAAAGRIRLALVGAS